METLDVLPGEGDVEVVSRTRVRRVCQECGESAHFMQSYLLEGTRSNPGSSAYGRDDCSWCSDEDEFFCREHKEHGRHNPPHGFVLCSLFPATERFKHMFLYWEEVAAPTEE